MGALQELWRGGSTLVVVTHDKALAKRANRVIEIRDGKVVEDSTNG